MLPRACDVCERKWCVAFLTAMLAAWILKSKEDLKRDFVEGVRAALVDKDRQPKWSPGSVSELTAAHVDAFFEPLDEQHRSHYNH